MTDEPNDSTPSPSPDPAGAPTPGGQTTVATPEAAAPPEPANGFGTAALVLGIVAVVAAVNGWWLFLLPVAIATAVLAIVFGVTGRRRADDGRATNRGQATAGLTLGIVASALVVAGGVAFAVWGDGWDRDKDDGVEECIDDADDVDELRECVDEFPELLEELTS